MLDGSMNIIIKQAEQNWIVMEGNHADNKRIFYLIVRIDM